MIFGRQGAREWPECELRVFYRLSLLNFVLAGGGFFLIGWSGVGGAAFSAHLAFFWLMVFAFPVYTAIHLEWSGPVTVLMCFLNPFIYGAMWWAIWRMCRLLRSKRTKSD
jgi:hypothetical protein